MPRALQVPLHLDVANLRPCHAILVSPPLPIHESVDARLEANHTKSSRSILMKHQTTYRYVIRILYSYRTNKSFAAKTGQDGDRSGHPIVRREPRRRRTGPKTRS